MEFGLYPSPANRRVCAEATPREAGIELGKRLTAPPLDPIVNQALPS
jgi:hypothetical protein